jgi:dienelactone hydrolase
MQRFLPPLLIALTAAPACGDELTVKAALARAIIGPRQSLIDLQDYLEPRVPKVPDVKAFAEWEGVATRLRQDILDKVVLSGAAKKWQAAKLGVEYLGSFPGEGYKVRKLRYEAVPGLWIPALLYLPDKLAGKVPVALAVNGHDGNGKAAKYKQIRCINLAKRGMIVLNVEWFGMGQLRVPGNQHGCMNQLDLCGTSGLAPFYLSMSRALDVLLAQPHADTERVAVSGLSGGGWQTIVISSLDTRVTLANPVAGYSGFRVRLRDHFKDLGDSEQTPVDLATLADYTHLTALRAPRPTLLTYNAKDDCCFEAGYALPPLLAAAGPIYRLAGKKAALRSHVNHDPGTHNYEKDNRQAFYRMIGDFFYPGDKAFDANEIPCDKEVKAPAELNVELPKDNATFNTLALALAKDLPRGGELPVEAKAARAWQAAKRRQLGEVLRVPALTVKAAETARTESKGMTATFWNLRLGEKWSVPVVELVRGKPAKTTIVLGDGGRQGCAASAERLLAAGQRVLAVDPFYFGEARLESRDWLFALLVSCVGDRPLGLQAAQLVSVARWSRERHGAPVDVLATGPRTSLVALAAAALEEKAIAGVEVEGSRASLHEVIRENRTVDQMPEVFCFGLLEVADVKQLAALVAPRPVVLRKPVKALEQVGKDLDRWQKVLQEKETP